MRNQAIHLSRLLIALRLSPWLKGHPGPGGPYWNIPPSERPNVLRRVVENKQTLRKIADDYGISYEIVRTALISILEEEVIAFMGARPMNEHTQERRDHLNGSYTWDLETSVGPLAKLPVPHMRRGDQTLVFERYHRRRAELDGRRSLS